MTKGQTISKHDGKKYIIGTYYFPGWETEQNWQPIKVQPLLGRYNQANPKVLEQQIEWAAAYGINFFAFDWYWHLGKTRHNSALDAFLKAKNLQKMKFCIHACNEEYFHAKSEGKTKNYADWGIQWELDSPEDFTHDFSEKDFLEMFEETADKYFSSPQYLTVDGKPVFIQYRTNLILRIFGIEGTKSIYDKVRRMLAKKGFGLYLVAGGSCVHPEYLESIKPAGFDAATSYNYPWAKTKEIVTDDASDKCKGRKRILVGTYDNLVLAYKEIWEKIKRISDKVGLDFIPPVLSGFDNSPGGGTVINLGHSPEKFKRMCQNAIPFINSRLNMVLVCAWNEWGENSVIEPAKEWGFQYLDALKNVYIERRDDGITDDSEIGHSKRRCSEATAEESPSKLFNA